MFVRDIGSGPVVLWLHGTPTPADDWMSLAEQLASRYRSLVPDLPGYGRSASSTAQTVEQVGDELAAMLKDRDVTSIAAIVGYSTGAYRAFDLALRHRFDVELIISLAGVAWFDDASRALRRDLAARFAADPTYIESPELRGLMPQLMLSDPWRATHPQDEERVIRWLEVTSSASLAVEALSLAASRDLRPELASLKSRVYARVGDLDRGCPPAWSEDIVRFAPRATLEIVPGCGHALLIEDTAATTAAILSQLEAR